MNTTDPTPAPAPETKIWTPPAWLVIGVLAIALAGGAYFVFTQLRPVPKPDATAFETPRPGDMRPRNNRNPNWANRGPNNNRPPAITPRPDAITQLTADNYFVKTGEAQARVRKNRNGAWEVNGEYENDAFLPQDVRTALQVRALVARPRIAAATQPANLSAAQVDQLRKVAQPPGMVLEATDRDRLTALFTTYAAAPDASKPAAEKAFVDALREVGAASKERTVALQTKRAEAVKSVLKPEQLETLSKSVRRG